MRINLRCLSRRACLKRLGLGLRQTVPPERSGLHDPRYEREGEARKYITRHITQVFKTVISLELLKLCSDTEPISPSGSETPTAVTVLGVRLSSRTFRIIKPHNADRKPHSQIKLRPFCSPEQPDRGKRKVKCKGLVTSSRCQQMCVSKGALSPKLFGESHIAAKKLKRAAGVCTSCPSVHAVPEPLLHAKTRCLPALAVQDASVVVD